MKHIFLVSLLFGTVCFSQTLSQLEKQRVQLPNGWSLTPIGKSLPLGDLPLNIAVSANKKLIAITNNGQSVQSIQLFDAQKEMQLDSVVVAKSWYGLAFSSDNQVLYASGGNDNWILKYAITNNKLQLKDSIKLGDKWPVRISPAGIAIDDARQLLYVVTKENNSLYIVDLRTKAIAGQYKLDGEGYSCLLSSTKKQLFISCWGCD